MNDIIINKTMDVVDLELKESKKVIDELIMLIEDLRRKKLKVSSWVGKFDLSDNPNSHEKINRGYGYKPLKGFIDDVNFPWFLIWEITWIIINNDFKKSQKILDLGGCSSLFSYYLASKGCEVIAIDLKKELIENGNKVSDEMGWKLKNYIMDMRDLSFDFKFDHITSLCVFEHIPYFDRVDISRKIKNHLVENGKFSITFDYKNPSRFAKISSPGDVYEQFVLPSGLNIRENKEFFDDGKNYLLNPFYFKKRLWDYKIRKIKRGHFSLIDIFKTKKQNDYTFGALFLENSI